MRAQPLRLWAAGKAYRACRDRLGRISSSFHQAESSTWTAAPVSIPGALTGK